MKFSPSCPESSGTDADLLRAFATGRNEAAFRALTERYAGLVYGIAVRRLEDAGAAQEVTSEVFTLLAAKAPGLTGIRCLAAWLQRSAVLVTANAARRETRRRLAMNAYTASLDPTPRALPPTEDPAWREALGHLDESLAKLPERDRQLILAKYFTGRTHGEIAAESGAGEEAVKKAGQRALQKLRALLMRRGVALPMAALTSGLARQVQAAAPEGTAFQASGAALRAADSIGLVQHLQHSLAYMFYGKTLTATAAALLLCAALGGGSFFTARQLAMMISPSSGSPAVARLSAPATDSAASSADKTAARSVNGIVREAVELLRRSRRERSPEMDRAILLLAGLSSEEMPEAARGTGEYLDDRLLGEALVTALAAAWAEQDPAAALAWLEVVPLTPKNAKSGGADKIMATWFGKDAPAAWQWWTRRSQASPPPFPGWESCVGESMGNWARRDPSTATAAVGQMNVSTDLLQGFAGQLSQMTPSADSPAIDAAMTWKNASMRAELAVFLAAGMDPFGKGTAELERLFPVLNRLCEEDSGALEAASVPLIRRWAAEAPEKALNWVLDEAAPSSANTRTLLSPALKVWEKNSPDEAWKWMRNRMVQDPGQAERIYETLLSADPNSPMTGSPWIPDSSASRLLESPAEIQDRFVHFWAEQRLRSALGNTDSFDAKLASWRTEISTKEANASTASAMLAKRALQLAEDKSQASKPGAPSGSLPGTAPSIP